MHGNSFKLMKAASEEIADATHQNPISVLDVGSRIAPGKLSGYSQIFCDSRFRYLGIDIEDGDNVDLVLSSPYSWPEIESSSYDMVISGQVLEHVPLFWELLKEMSRVTRPGGFLVLVVPSKGAIHKHPVDCYRFNPDGLISLATWLDYQVVSLKYDPGSYWGDVIMTAQKRQLPTIDSKLEHFPLLGTEIKIVTVSRMKRIRQILITVIVAIIGDRIFQLIIGGRNVIHTRMFSPMRRKDKAIRNRKSFK